MTPDITRPARTNEDKALLLEPGMATWTTPAAVSRENDQFVLADRPYPRVPQPSGADCVLLLRTETGWWISGDLDRITTRRLDPRNTAVPAQPATATLLDNHQPDWRLQFHPDWSPDPSPRTAAAHLRVADLHAAQMDPHSNTLDPALRLAEYHQRHAHLRLDALHRLPTGHPQLTAEDTELATYLTDQQ